MGTIKPGAPLEMEGIPAYVNEKRGRDINGGNHHRAVLVNADTRSGRYLWEEKDSRGVKNTRRGGGNRKEY